MEHGEPPPSARNVRNLCRKVFSAYGPHNWNVAPAFQSSDFAAFLNAVGPRNAADLSSLSFWSHDADQMAICLPVATELIAHHLPRLQRLKIHVNVKDVWWDEDPLWYHPLLSSPFWANGAFWPLYEAVENLVERVEWLKIFEYKGQPAFAENEGGYGDLKALEELVELRAGGLYLGDIFDLLNQCATDANNPWLEFRGSGWYWGYDPDNETKLLEMPWS